MIHNDWATGKAYVAPLFLDRYSDFKVPFFSLPNTSFLFPFSFTKFNYDTIKVSNCFEGYKNVY